MTALAGFVSFGGAGAPRPNCERMLAAQRIYGPDGTASWGEGPAAIGRSLYKCPAEGSNQ